MTSAALEQPPVRGLSVPRGIATPIVAAGVIAALTASWLSAAGIVVLWAIWVLLYEPGEGIVLPLALTFQWLQVTIGQYYFAFTGRRLAWDYDVETDPMIVLGLGAVLALAVGVRLGKNLLPPNREAATVDAAGRATTPILILVYAAFLLSSDLLSRLAWGSGGLAQLVLSLMLVRFIFLYMLVARVGRSRWAPLWIGLIFSAELAVGLSGYFARFRESFVIAFLAVSGTARVLRARHVAAFGILTIMAVAVAWVWTGVKQDYRMDYEASGSRADRIIRIHGLTQAWLRRPEEVMEAGDALIDRIWSVEYQAHALERVPAIVPHENGKVLLGAIQHVFLPRAFFPDKPLPVHPSDMVRKYAGVWVAGEEVGVSFAFGYAAEAYVDFGVPIMFLPVLIFGLLAGLGFNWMRRNLHDPLLRAATLSTLFWVSLYLYERSWLRMIGLSITWFVGVGLIALALDRLWLKARPTT